MGLYRPLSRLSLTLGAVFWLLGCTGITHQKDICTSETNTAWKELSVAKAQGFSGSVSYAKALSLLTAAKTLQAVENFGSCYNNAKNARFYIRESQQGR